MNDDEAKRKILARRAAFVAAALAGVSAACGKEPQRAPQPPPSVPLASPEGVPQPCLSPPLPPDAGAEGAPTPDDASSAERGATDAGASPATTSSVFAKPPFDAAAPRPCLSPVSPHRPLPRPCLSITAPKDTK